MTLPNPTPWWNAYTEAARYINMGLLIIVIAGFSANMIVRRSKTPRRTRRIGWNLFVLLCTFVYGYSVSIKLNRPYNDAVGIGTVVLVCTIAAIVWHPEGDDKLPPHDGALTNRFMFWLDKKVRDWKSRHGGENDG